MKSLSNLIGTINDLLLSGVLIAIVAITFVTAVTLTPIPAIVPDSSDSRVLGVAAGTDELSIQLFDYDSPSITVVSESDTNTRILLEFESLPADGVSFPIAEVVNSGSTQESIFLEAGIPDRFTEGIDYSIKVNNEVYPLIRAGELQRDYNLDIRPGEKTTISLELSPETGIAYPIEFTLDFDLAKFDQLP